MTQLNVSYDEVEQIFALWLKKFQEDPDAFEDDYGEDTNDYGESCAAYFTKLLSEIKVDNFGETEDAE